MKDKVAGPASSKGKKPRQISLYNLHMRYLGHESMDSFGWVPISDFNSKSFENFLRETMESNPFAGIYRYFRDYSGTLYVLMDKSAKLYALLNSEKAGTGLKDEIGATEALTGKPISQSALPYQKDLQKDMPSYFKDAQVVIDCLRGNAIDPTNAIKLITKENDPIRYIEYSSFIVDDLNIINTSIDGTISAHFNCTGGVLRGISSKNAIEHAAELQGITSNAIDMIEPPQQLTFQLNFDNGYEVLDQGALQQYSEVIEKAIEQDLNIKYPGKSFKKVATRFILIKKQAIDVEEENKIPEVAPAKVPDTVPNELPLEGIDQTVDTKPKTIEEESRYKINGYYMDFKRGGIVSTKVIYSVLGDESMQEVTIDVANEGFTLYDFINKNEGIADIQTYIYSKIPGLFGKLPFAILSEEKTPISDMDAVKLENKMNVIFRNAVISKIDVNALKAVYDSNQLEDVQNYYNKKSE